MIQIRFAARVAALFAAAAIVTTSTAQNPDAPDPAARAEMIDGLATWTKGPSAGRMDNAEIKLPAGYRFCGASDTQKILAMNRNVTSGHEKGFVAPLDMSWFAVFVFDDCGYVKDDEKDTLDADAMMSSMKEGTKEGNKERKKRGWPELELIGWFQPPLYDPETNNLTWATRNRSEGDEGVNYNVRLLGRSGVMEVTLVAGVDEMNAALPKFKELLKGYKFSAGSTYAEFTSGDKLATYGLAALVTGGAAAIALKTGILQKFGKFIVIAVVAVVAGIAKFFKKIWAAITGRNA